MKRHWLTELATIVALSGVVGGLQIHCPRIVSGQEHPAIESQQAVFLPYAQFQIPFNIDSIGAEPALVQLFVSTDDGTTWQMHGSAKPNAQRFEFRAAAEGNYLFSVRTVDASGVSFPSPSPPLRIEIDTTKPQAAMRADLDGAGNLVVDLRVLDQHLDLQTATLRVRTDRDTQWREIPVNFLAPNGKLFEGQIELEIPQCHEVALVFSVSDFAKNTGEATFQFSMPRTAANEHDMQLASNRKTSPVSTSPTQTLPNQSAQVNEPISDLQLPPDFPGAVAWNSEAPRQHASPWSNGQITPPNGQLTSAAVDLDLAPSGDRSLVLAEELPAPTPMESQPSEPVASPETTLSPERELPTSIEKAPPNTTRTVEDIDTRDLAPFARAYHCKSREFSLDYSVEALGGSALAEVELWGSEDNGQTWQLWGSDPDRQSPFDVQVGNDGLFGFRMVVVGSNGIVSGRPKAGEAADVWINVDTEIPTGKITRAVYGEGPEDGMLVIDYNCLDRHLVEHPITLSFSENLEGPWTTIATGLKNTGLYLWKADPNLPSRIYLKMDVVDKAGNIGSHRLDLPIDIRGLAPRGRIQGFRPISSSK